MQHAFRNTVFALATACIAIGCTEQPTERIAASVDDWNWRPPIFNSGCNGINGSQLRTPLNGVTLNPDRGSTYGGDAQRLERVVVYGTPVQRPYRGYGDAATYGGATNVFIYDRNILDQCTFGDGLPYTVIGPEADDTLDVNVPPEGVDQELWDSVSPRVRKQLRAAAWYLADHWIPNDIPGIGLLTVQARRALIFQALANGYKQAREVAPDRRRETVMFVQSQRGSTYQMKDSELLRLDAFLIGCATSQRFRAMDSWSAEQAQDYASRITSAWATDQTRAAGMYWLEPQLTRMGALGAELGREGNSCGSAARYHFENTSRDLFDPSSGGFDGNQL